MRFLILLSVLFVQTVLGQSIFAPFREGKSNYVSEKQAQKATGKFNGNEAILLETLSRNLSSIADFHEFTKVIQKSYDSLPGKKTDLSYAYLDILILMRANDLIDDILFRLLRDHFEQFFYVEPIESSFTQQRPAGPRMPLKDYIAKKESIKKSFFKLSKYKEEVVTSSQLNPFPIKQFKVNLGDYHSLSARERLFYLYTPAQIREMALIMDLALSIADAKTVYTTIEFRNGSSPMVINHSPTDQYRLALRIMRLQKDEAQNDQSRLGTYVNDLDLIVAAYELGVVSYDEISLVANNKDFYLPEISFGKKVVNYITSLASIAVRVHPVTAPYAIIPIMIYNSYAEVKKAQTKIDEEAFIFSLPKRN